MHQKALEAIRANIACLAVVAVADGWHGASALEAPTHAVVDTTRLPPCLLHRGAKRVSKPSSAASHTRCTRHAEAGTCLHCVIPVALEANESLRTLLHDLCATCGSRHPRELGEWGCVRGEPRGRMGGRCCYLVIADAIRTTPNRGWLQGTNNFAASHWTKMARELLLLAAVLTVLVSPSLQAGCHGSVRHYFCCLIALISCPRPTTALPTCSPSARARRKRSSSPPQRTESWYCSFYSSTRVLSVAQYLVTVPNSGGGTTSNFSVVHVWGTPYEMGTVMHT